LSSFTISTLVLETHPRSSHAPLYRVFANEMGRDSYAPVIMFNYNQRRRKKNGKQRGRNASLAFLRV